MSSFGLIKNPYKLVEKISKFHQNPQHSDVTLIVGGKKFIAHRFVLAMHSDFFGNLLLNENYREARQPEVSIVAPIEAFTLLLQYMYTGEVDLRKHEVTVAAEFLEICHRYGFTELEEEIVDYLSVVVDVASAVEVLEVAKALGRKNLEKHCWILIKMSIEGIIELDLTFEVLEELVLEQGKLLNPVNLFKAVIKFTKDPNFCTEEQKKELLKEIKYEKMTGVELLRDVEPNIGPNDEIDLSKYYRGLVLDNSQRVHEGLKLETKAVVTANKWTEAHLFSSGDQFTEAEPEGSIMIDLEAIYSFNHLQCKIFSWAQRIFPFGLRIEVSKDKENWETVVDISEIRSKEKQNLYFHETRAKFIRISNPHGWSLKCNSFKISFNENPPKFLESFVVPNQNVVIADRALVHYFDDGQIYNDHHLLDKTGNKETQFVSTKLKLAYIAIVLNQPYILDSLRIKLWDGDGRKYSFEVFVALERVVPETIFKSAALVNGWQEIHFSPRLVSRMFIEGIEATIGDELRIAEFEAPTRATKST